MVVSQQREVIIGAVANAVGINMTFLLPYSLLRKGWDREFRGLAMADLGLGLFVPFVLATGCVVVASAARFHAEPAPGFLGEVDARGEVIAPDPGLVRSFHGLLEQRLRHDLGGQAFAALGAEERRERIEALPEADRRLAAVLVRRDAFHLAGALEPLTGRTVAHTVFGLGVLGMAVSTIVILMLIAGLCVSEMLGQPSRGATQWAGALLVSIGVLGPVFWNDAKLWLAMPTAAFGMTLLPIAYLAFFALMNSRRVLGKDRPSGWKRAVGNILLAGSCAGAGASSLWVLWSKLGGWGLAVFGVFSAAVLLTRRRESAA
ncbi:MAG: hypothetical protein D6781_09875 [Verrucomicrobia bacterium]|nr:MAG: hypothetical protein D6781_09875 [Verrucomicrobiota bacterium]